jgi:hypothetical protein
MGNTPDEPLKIIKKQAVHQKISKEKLPDP